MAKCGQACPYNTLDGCKVKEYNAICPLTNMATPVTEYRMTNADRIRAMSDEELAAFLLNFFVEHMDINGIPHEEVTAADKLELLRQLQQPAEEDTL